MEPPLDRTVAHTLTARSHTAFAHCPQGDGGTSRPSTAAPRLLREMNRILDTQLVEEIKYGLGCAD